ncbi:MAG: chorismate synthase [Bacteroidetes bacterium]|nr:chorismate synthase [Bacteroidota bacterium]
MAGNSFGTIFKLTSFGESHGEAIGGVIDGCPAGLKIDFSFIQNELNRRKPGQSKITTTRNESDSVEFLSGIFDETTTGTPIAFIVKNNDSKSADYEKLKDVYRPGHADYTFDKKFGIRDYRGGGRSSARETISRVVAGAIAKLLLKQENVLIYAFVKQVGKIATTLNYNTIDVSAIENSMVRCPDTIVAEQMIKYINELKLSGNTVGGIIQCAILNTPTGLGEPVFDKLNATLAHAMFSINAVKGFEVGEGFNSINKLGSELNDAFVNESNSIKTLSNNSGGIQGGISNGMPIYFNVAFKPISSILQKQNTLNILGEKIEIKISGRHDPCVLPRAVPIVESMAALVIADYFLLSKLNKL